MKSTLFSIFFVILSCQLLAQSVSDCHKEGGAFISEIYNEGKGDYIELTVYGSTANPTAPVNLEGWILDDNNASKKNVGNESGHIRLGSCFAAVNPGTLIVIYTPKYGSKPFVDVAKDGFFDYAIQTSRTCLEPYAKCPNRFTQNTGYDCDRNDYSINPKWDLKGLIPLYNGGDALQLRNKEGVLEHAIYWTTEYEEKDNPKAVDISSKIPVPSFGTTTVNKLSIHFTADKDWFNVANYEVNTAFTLGVKNNDAHGALIEKCKNGTFSSALKVTVAEKNKPTSKDNDGIIEVKIEGGQAKYKVSLFSDDYNTWEFFDAQGTYSFDRLPSGTYSVLVEDGEFCPVFTDITLEKTEAECQGTCKNIGVAASEYCRYQWISPDAVKNETNSEIKVCPFETTTYVLKVMDKEGNIKELKYRVEVKEAFIDPSPILYCGGTKTITVQGKQPHWKHNDSMENSTEIDEAGEYYLQVTDESGCRINGKVEVLDANDPVAIKKYFEARGFNAVTQNVSIEKVAGKPAPKGADRVAPCTQVFGNDKLFINGKFLNLEELTADICYYEPDFANSHLITDNESFCKNGNLDLIEQAYASNDKAIWYHLYKNGAENILFYKQSKPKEKKNKCSLDNLKVIFKKYNGNGKYKMLFVVPDLDNKTYIEVATLKNDWLFGVVTIESQYQQAVIDAFNDKSLTQHEKEKKMRNGNKTYNMNSVRCFYEDVRKDFFDNDGFDAKNQVSPKIYYNTGYPNNLAVERAIPMYENNVTYLISISEKNYPVNSGGERCVSEDININPNKDIDIVTKNNPNVDSWLHNHPHADLRKKLKIRYAPNYTQLLELPYYFDDSPSPSDEGSYNEKVGFLNIATQDNIFIFFTADSTFFNLERKGFDK